MIKVRGFEYVVQEHRKNEGEFNLPKRGDKRSAGYDFYSPVDISIPSNSRAMIWLDVKAYMMEDEVLSIYPRSSQGKLDIRLANTVGIIDSSYYSNEGNDGNIGVMIRTGEFGYDIKKGDRICQGVFTKYLVADNDETLAQERKGGYGSTGK